MSDIEKQNVTGGKEYQPNYDHRGSSNYADGTVPGESFAIGETWYAKLQRLAGKYGVEQRGIERVPEEERVDVGFKSLLNTGTMWLSANMVVSSFALGLLGKSVYNLGFVDAVLVILFFNLIGILPVCYYSTFGPRFGLRQMVLSRFFFGWHGVKLVGVFNTLACVGWSAVNCIVGAQLIYAVNNDVPGFAGIIIISICTLIICLFGYKVVHVYEFWSWIPTFIVFLITLGIFAHSGDFVNMPMGTGKVEMGSIFGFGATIFGFATGWSTYAADYTVYMPSSTSRVKVFFATFTGLIIPLLFTEILAAAVMTATSINGGDNIYMEGYESSGAGGLLAAVLFPKLGGFGRFCLILMALSIVANNCPNVYSVALTMQIFGRWTQRIPRFVWTIIGTCVYVAIAIAGYSHFEEALDHFLVFIGYWLAIYTGIVLTDHFVFKRGFSGYRPEYYDQPSKLPHGIAAVVAFCFGIVGMVVGMSQVWFVGPIALHAGEAPIGGDVGFELAFAFAAVSYLGLRTLELKYFGR
ncbi:cytosine-purine permease [Eremomyces bilateralis CBS 781.70]|uniref:Cytosine-purine permease n=1 Tax=Eremomyces bilateralis CBS 781.70 TaxID=1392243 RepID=A0A6G1FYD6_9PEZI|nr:cytosine-purine permease [Eremomyces bilateralis CBS 781.70]KAF1810857.1 cytosine-purine permease [Eremomyces bilateralis CBS 781.70]